MRRLSILIADDDRHLRESLQDVLADLGFESSNVGCGSEAIDALTKMHCDLLLSDVDMPDMTGFQLLAWVTDRSRLQPPPLSPAPRVALMSARADDHLGREAQRAGALTLLPKPVALPALTALINQLCDQ